MKQILFVIAMKKEATDIAEKLKLEKINENVYRKENISLIITGIGKQQTAINLTRYLENCDIKPDLIINMLALLTLKLENGLMLVNLIIMNGTFQESNNILLKNLMMTELKH